ncbi:MAG: SUMF1/EgtB/PvdO family nonheme iron enzyme [Acidobacteria bacterium]|nr:SUMF1/EgtB/PvdO family nonheme iron enzyme [Acidobacteriota bacterium]
MARIDKYEIIEEIGRGGMGAVYKALHPQFKKYVAIKEVRADLANNREILRRFEQEIELLAQLPTHPNIVTVRDALLWENRLYIVMDYIEGETLSEVTEADGLEAERGAALLDQILSGLEAIHSRGIVHRDLKASNILIDHAGKAYITDFGIAEYTNRQSNAVVMATPRYAAPELIDKQMRRSGSDQQIDIYAAGILAYEMLLGEPAMRRALPDIFAGEESGSADRWLRWHISLAKPATRLHELNPAIPKRLAKIVARMMEKDVTLRYKEAWEIRRDLQPLLASKPSVSAAQAEAQNYFEETVALDRTQGGKTNLVGPDTAAFYQTHPEDAAPLATVATEPTPVINTAAGLAVETAPTDEEAAGLKPALLWMMVAGVAFVAVLFLVWWLWPAKGFTLILRGAPANSAVFIDSASYGVTDANGSLTINDIEAGKRQIRVVNEGYRDFLALVEAQKGSEQVVIANLEKIGLETPVTLPPEVDFSGTMLLIPAGDFMMGDDKNLPNEKPAHTVNLPNYYLDKFEVTNTQYKEFCDKTGRATPTNTSFNKAYFANQPNAPVIGVSFEDAMAYAAWANKRLPTEEEWEKAASWGPQAVKKRQWPWGDKPETDRANVANPEKKPVEVGRFPKGASAYGVMDMAGNASEWVDGFYQAYTGNQNTDPDFGTTYRVIRGGDFISSLQDSRTTRRQYFLPTYKEHVERLEENGVTKEVEKNSTAGFRCAISANDPRLQAFLRKR